MRFSFQAVMLPFAGGVFKATLVSEEAQWVAHQRFHEARKIVEPTQEDGGLSAVRSYIAASRV